MYGLGMNQFLLLCFLYLDHTELQYGNIHLQYTYYNMESVTFPCFVCVGKALSFSSFKTNALIKGFCNMLQIATMLVCHVGSEGWSYLKAKMLSWCTLMSQLAWGTFLYSAVRKHCRSGKL